MMINFNVIGLLICIVIPLTCALISVNREMSNDDNMPMRITIFLLSLGAFISVMAVLVREMNI
jgi:uncharacterized membrane protein YhaH (DUF805 family)